MVGVPVWIDRDALQLHVWVTETVAHAGLFDLVPVLLSRRGVGGAVWQPPVVVSVLPIIHGGLGRPWIGNAHAAVLEAAPTRHYATENGLVRVPGLRQGGAAKALVRGSLCCPRDEGDGLCLSAVGVFELGFAPLPVPHLLGSAAARFDLGRGAAEHLQADIRVPGRPCPQGHGLLAGLLPLPGAAQLVGQLAPPAQHGSALGHLQDTEGSSQSNQLSTSPTSASCPSAQSDPKFNMSMIYRNISDQDSRCSHSGHREGIQPTLRGSPTAQALLLLLGRCRNQKRDALKGLFSDIKIPVTFRRVSSTQLEEESAPEQ